MINRHVKPAGFRVLVKLKKIDESTEIKSDSGLVLEIKSKESIEREKRSTQEAYVMSLGPTAFKAFDDGRAWCKEGDCVLICKYSGDDLTDVEDGEIYRIISDRDIEAVFEGEGL